MPMKLIFTSRLGHKVKHNVREKRFGISYVTTGSGRLRLEVHEQNVVLVAGRSSYNIATRRWKLNSAEHYYRPPILLGTLVAVV